jgi:chitinase
MKAKKRSIIGSIITPKSFFAAVFALLLFLAVNATCFATTVELQWDPKTEPGHAGYKVYYRADTVAFPFDGTGATEGAAPIDVHNQTIATIGGLDPEHSYHFLVTSYDTSGIESGYSNIVSVPELVAPDVSISYPANNSVVSATISVTAGASDNVGVTKVDFYVNDVLQATEISTPYVYSWNTSLLAAGSYVLKAKAYDAAGNIGQSSDVTVLVGNDNTPPSISLTAPASNTTVSGTVAVTANAGDNVGVSSVEFYVNGAFISAGNVPPYSYSWNTKAAANGAYTLSARAYDAAGNIGQASNISVTVNNPVPDANPVTVTTASLPTATLGTYFYSYLAASGGTKPYTWSITAGKLPTGMTLNASNGGITGTASVGGAFTFTVKAADANGLTVTKSLTLNVDVTPVAVSTASLSTATLGTYFYSYLAASGGAKPYTWAITSGKLPTGMTLNASNGGITGNPGAAGSFPFTVRVTDTKGTAASKSLTLIVNDPIPPVVSGFTVPASATSLTVSVTLFTATDNIGVTGYMITESGTPPSPGLAGWVSSSPAGYVATSDGSHTLYPWARDAAGNVSAVYGLPKTVIITLPDTTKPAVSLTAPANNATVNGTVSIAASASDNVGVSKVEIYVNGVLKATKTGSPFSYSWDTKAGANGAYTLSARAYDAAGNMGQSSTLSVSVNNPLPDTQAPTVTAFTIPSTATSLIVAINSFTAGDNVGVTGYKITESSTPPLPGSAGWTSASPASYSAASAGNHTLYPWTRDAAGNVSPVYASPKTVSITLPPAVTVSTTTLPSATVGTYFYSYLAASGGTKPYTWTITSGKLPTGMTLNASNGGITGTPGIGGAFTFTVKITDANGSAATKSLTLNVGVAPLTVTTASLPTATLGTYFYSYLAASGGAKPYTWAITSGKLPTGMTLNASNGGITGTPGAVGSFTFTVRVTDTKGTAAAKSFTFIVNGK